MHQALDSLCWDMTVLLEKYKCLQDHLGFPDGSFDPVFLQDKISYLFAMDEDDVLPTFKLDMPSVDEEVVVVVEIHSSIL
jgi:hypothetical protein